MRVQVWPVFFLTGEYDERRETIVATFASEDELGVSISYTGGEFRVGRTSFELQD